MADEPKEKNQDDLVKSIHELSDNLKNATVEFSNTLADGLEEAKEPKELKKKISDATDKYRKISIFDVAEALALSKDMETIKDPIGILAKANLKLQVEKVKFCLDNAEQILRTIDSMITELYPYLIKELEKPEYAGKSMHTLLHTLSDEVDADNQPISAWEKIVNDARRAFEKAKNVPHVNVKSIDKSLYMLDKLNCEMWKFSEKDAKETITFAMEKQKSKRNVDLYFSIDFDALQINLPKKLTSFDKRVYISASSLYDHGNSIVSATQIFFQMGNTSRPTENQLKKILDSLVKMMGILINIDNTQEAQIYRYAKFVYTGALFPAEIVSAYINGKFTDSAIHMFREPPLTEFAKSRNQITTFKIELLQSPVSKTESNLALEDYLITRIKRSKSKKFRILLDTLYKKVGATTKKQKQRIPEKVDRYLTHYETCGEIKKYTLEKDGITIYM